MPEQTTNFDIDEDGVPISEASETEPSGSRTWIADSAGFHLLERHECTDECAHGEGEWIHYEITGELEPQILLWYNR